ncbi:MAG: PhnA domain protein [Campylobacteraceae bacterium]|jgi:protein PhnA|nr:PhnA domain protein [Campylobacteraceae bacterium]MBT4030391.1 PhnA domain protein [Campylobacteraceae bacterium]MBT4179752.1 PhnA domain protein [Campylobacteraceae bacterium]MBT4572604.1 PhnA domain protein [Campylobacteraceae bacterium]MBT4708215.1 PhnA domain protein [Campylobacteraceae bacterium]
MSTIDQKLLDRSENKCELCGSGDNLDSYKVEPKDEEILVCGVCKEQIEDNSKLDETHMYCLNDSMWSEVDAVKVVAYRLFSIMKNQDMLDMMYLEDDVKQWADDGLPDEPDEDALIYRDSNGVILNAGDTVVIVKDLPVKGAGFVAKQGVAVRNIGLVPGDETHIEGRVNGVKVHLKTCFLKKS